MIKLRLIALISFTDKKKMNKNKRMFSKSSECMGGDLSFS